MNWEWGSSHSVLSGVVLVLAGDSADNHETCQCSHSVLSGAVLALAAENHETCQQIFGGQTGKKAKGDICV